ncbi:threonine/serine exporter family protein [Catenulispora subtropica]|uniref:Threonine/serine exporter family protein n=1 Tax=Catenulispora subtropica TaxID=450798 RepID=A0ABN2RUG1_9ACTN
MQSDEHRSRIRGAAPRNGLPEERPVEPSSAARVIDLALRIGELLLASGEGSEDVEVSMLGITEAYGLVRCETNVTFTVITLSYQPGVTETPISLERVVRHRTVDYTGLADLHRLAVEISLGGVSLEDAYGRLAAIRRNKYPYPHRAIVASLGGIAATAAILVGGGYRASIVAFVCAILGDFLYRRLARLGLPPFYLLAVAAVPGAIAAIILDRLGVQGINSSAVVVGGVFTVLPGRALVAAIQDGLTGFYITASARLLEVVFLVGALVSGITLVLMVGRHVGASFIVDEQLAPVRADPAYALVAAALGVSFAVAVHTPRRILPFAAGGAAFSWAGATYGVQWGLSPVIATTVTAMTVGLIGYLIARRYRTSALPYVIPAIGPLLPGSAVYFAMLQITSGDSGRGLASLETAVSLGLGIGAGVNLGGELARVLGRSAGRTELIWRFRRRLGSGGSAMGGE